MHNDDATTPSPSSGRCPSYFYDKADAPWHCRGDVGHLADPHPEDPKRHYCGPYTWDDALGEAKREPVRQPIPFGVPGHCFDIDGGWDHDPGTCTDRTHATPCCGVTPRA